MGRARLGVVARLAFAAQAPRDALAVVHHGDIAYATGPIPLLKQLGILVKLKPFPGAPPVKVGKHEYFMTTDPTKVLRCLQGRLAEKWPDGAPVSLASGLDACRFQRALGEIFAECLINCGDCTSAWHARKITWTRMGGLATADFHSCRVADLASASPDSKGGLALLPETMRLSVLATSFFDLHPMLWSLVFCQWTDAGVDAKWVEDQQNALIH